MIQQCSTILATQVPTQSEIGWLYPWPTWVWVLALLASIALPWIFYRNVPVEQPIKWVLGSIRGLLLFFLILLLAGPVLETPTVHHIEDQIIVLLDRSGSLTIADVPKETGDTGTRDEQLVQLLGDSESWSGVTSNRIIRWMGFHDHAFTLEYDQEDSPTPQLSPPTGRQTDIPGAIEQAVSSKTTNPVSAILLVSDGKSNQNIPPGFTSSLRAQGIPVISIPLGPTVTSGDLGVRTVVAPGFAYVGDRVPVIVHLDQISTSKNMPGGDVVLLNQETGEELDRVQIRLDDSEAEYTLVGEPRLRGETTWRVELDLDEQDLVSANNQVDLLINLLDHPLRVLYIEGVPRWEYRYLKNLLIRESSIISSVMLLSADSDYAQEGNRPITRIPSSREEFLDFDVVILGDLPSSTLSSEQSEIIEQLVAEGALGLVWVGGGKWTPESWGDSSLNNLLPFIVTPNLQNAYGSIHLQPTEEAVRIGVLQISEVGESGWPTKLSDTKVPWSAFQWTQRIDEQQLKPTAQILAEAVETSSDPSGTFPLILSIRYGAGRSTYIATDEFWRWRHGRGERLYEQFWIQIIRSLARARMEHANQSARLIVTPREVEVRQPIQLELRLLDESINSKMGGLITCRITNRDGKRIDDVDLYQRESSQNSYSANWIPTRPGRYVFTPDISGLDLEQSVLVLDPSDELSNPGTDHGLLEHLAEETGGHIITPAKISSLPDLVPDRSITMVEVHQRTIWDSPWLLVIPLVLLTLEWLGRRIFRLA